MYFAYVHGTMLFLICFYVVSLINSNRCAAQFLYLSCFFCIGILPFLIDFSLSFLLDFFYYFQCVCFLSFSSQHSAHLIFNPLNLRVFNNFHSSIPWDYPQDYLSTSNLFPELLPPIFTVCTCCATCFSLGNSL